MSNARATGTSSVNTGAIVQRAEIVGLRDFQVEINSMARRFPSEVGKTNAAVVRLIINTAKEKAASRPQTALAARSLRYEFAGTHAAVSLRNVRGFELGAEFGAKKYKQFPPWRGNQWTDPPTVGYFLHPAIRDDEAQIIAEYEHMIDRLSMRAFPSV